MGDGAVLRLETNLSSGAIVRRSEPTDSMQIWGDEVGGLLPPWSVLWRLGAR
jgi:maltooligosyltrehalose trehalohydrolase